jgi:aryl-alcohol dehydrogenase-like predicted oxidoreductase
MTATATLRAPLLDGIGRIGFGAWQIGDDAWGAVDERAALGALEAAADAGVTFYDTADVYGDGRSERLVGRFLAERGDPRLVVATKMGRRVPQVPENYTPEAFREWLERSRENLGVETIPLVQLHCPPTEVYYRPEVFEALDALVADGVIAHYGVSVEKVEEALKAIEYPGVASVQIIFNLFRQRPASLFLGEARRRGVAVVVRVPLASGLLTGKLSADSTFAENDHRHFNRHGESFDVGETFAGVPFEAGLEAVEELRALVPDGWSLAAFALRWILMHDAVSATIPGARNPDQARANAAVAGLPPLDDVTLARAAEIYAQRIAPYVHQRW